jgi:hypothetical protein
MMKRLLRRILYPRQERILRAVLVDARQRLIYRGASAAQAEEWVLEFVSYLRSPVPACQAMWRWVCRAYGTPDWAMRMHWVAAEAQRAAQCPCASAPPSQAVRTRQMTAVARMDK